MGISQKVAYLKGLADGLDIKGDSSESKLLLAIIDTLGEIADSIDNIEFDIDVIGDEVDDIDETLDYYFNYDDDSCSCGEDHHNHHHHSDDYEEYDGDIYQVVCPACDEVVFLDEDMLDDGELLCPKCHEKLEIDLSGAIDEE